MIQPRQRTILQALWRAGRLSRWELHEQTGIRPNTIGSDVGNLIQMGILREDYARSPSRGRPRVPLEIDPARRHVLGLAIRPGRVEVAQLNLLGSAIGPTAGRDTKDPASIITASSELLRTISNEQTLGIGLSTPGFVDPTRHQILLSSVTRGGEALDLQPVYESAGELPLVLENDMHALAARWLLTHQAEQSEDVLLGYVDDGQVGAALLIEGSPNRGVATGANELGHTRLPVETEVCYCGQKGCLERICSSTFVNQLNGRNQSLAERAAAFDGSDAALNRMMELMAIGLSNAVNFTRVNRLVLVGELVRHPAFAERLVELTRERMLRELANLVKVDLWGQGVAQTAETAGWLALASIYYEGWTRPIPKPAAT